MICTKLAVVCYQACIQPAAASGAGRFGAACTLAHRVWFGAPAARASVWSWLYGFGLIAGRAVEGQTVPIVAPAITPDAAPAISLAELRAQTPFAVAAPAWLPDGLTYSGGFLIQENGGVQVTQVYHRRSSSSEQPQPDTPFLLLVATSGRAESIPLVAAEYSEPATVRGQPAIYARGAWVASASDNNATNTVWDAAQDANWLSWQEEGRTYLLYAQELALDKSKFLQIAESLRTEE